MKSHFQADSYPSSFAGNATPDERNGPSRGMMAAQSGVKFLQAISSPPPALRPSLGKPPPIRQWPNELRPSAFILGWKARNTNLVKHPSSALFEEGSQVSRWVMADSPIPT